MGLIPIMLETGPAASQMRTNTNWFIRVYGGILREKKMSHTFKMQML